MWLDLGQQADATYTYRSDSDSFPVTVLSTVNRPEYPVTINFEVEHRFDVLPGILGGAVLSCFQCVDQLKPPLNRVAQCRRQEVRDLVRRSGFDSTFGKRDGRSNGEAGRLQTRVRRAFAGAVNAYNRFKEETVRHFVSPRGETSNGHHRFKHGADFNFAVGVHEGQDESDVVGFERLTRSGDHRAVH